MPAPPSGTPPCYCQVTSPFGSYTLASSGGSEAVKLGISTLAVHTHTTHVSTDPGNSGPANSIPAVSSNSQGAVSKPTYVAAAGATMTSLNSMTVVSPPGDGIPNMQPSIVVYMFQRTG